MCPNSERLIQGVQTPVQKFAPHLQFNSNRIASVMERSKAGKNKLLGLLCCVIVCFISSLLTAECVCLCSTHVSSMFKKKIKKLKNNRPIMLCNCTESFNIFPFMLW